MDPVFIWAPSPRCGSTLLQRLITSSGEVLVCGEDRLNFEHLPTSLSLAKAGEADANGGSEADGKARKEWLEERLERLANGEPDVYPIDAIPAEKHIALSQKQLAEAARMYQSVAEEYGYSRWGIKPTVAKPGAIRGLNYFFPNSRHVFIYRNIYDCFRSMKGQTRSGESWALDGAHGWRMYQVATLCKKRIIGARKKLDNLENFY
ncbi:MAG: sulfotransferase, partial [Bradymonadaceae bacterium]